MAEELKQTKLAPTVKRLRRALRIKPPIAGFTREWLRCNECGRCVSYDYVAFGLSQAVTWLPCGHGATQSLERATVRVSEYNALRSIAAARAKA